MNSADAPKLCKGHPEFKVIFINWGAVEEEDVEIFMKFRTEIQVEDGEMMLGNSTAEVNRLKMLRQSISVTRNNNNVTSNNNKL